MRLSYPRQTELRSPGPHNGTSRHIFPWKPMLVVISQLRYMYADLTGLGAAPERSLLPPSAVMPTSPPPPSPTSPKPSP